MSDRREYRIQILVKQEPALNNVRREKSEESSKGKKKKGKGS